MQNQTVNLVVEGKKSRTFVFWLKITVFKGLGYSIYYIIYYL
jgi:hypothetical protein